MTDDQIIEYCADLNHYDSDEFTPTDEINDILNNPDFMNWLDTMLRYATRMAIDLKEEETEKLREWLREYEKINSSMYESLGNELTKLKNRD